MNDNQLVEILRKIQKPVDEEEARAVENKGKEEGHESAD